MCIGKDITTSRLLELSGCLRHLVRQMSKTSEWYGGLLKYSVCILLVRR